MKSQKSIVQIRSFVTTATAYLKKHGFTKEAIDANGKPILDFSEQEDTLVSKNLKNIIKKQCAKIFEEFEETVEDMRLDHCATDPVKLTILRDENKGYVYTPEKLKAFNKLYKTKVNTQDIDVHLRLVEAYENYPWTEEEFEAFKGFIFPDTAEYKPVLKIVASEEGE
jgi:hypothetical protein